MNEAKNTMTVTVERIIPAPVEEVFDAWLNPNVPGNPWNLAEELILNPHEKGLFYWLLRGNAHYGRFTRLERPISIQHTWVSRSTQGQESLVVVTFEEECEDTRMTLVHSGLPDTEGGRGHEKGWTFFMDGFQKTLSTTSAEASPTASRGGAEKAC